MIYVRYNTPANKNALPVIYKLFLFNISQDLS